MNILSRVANGIYSRRCCSVQMWLNNGIVQHINTLDSCSHRWFIIRHSICLPVTVTVRVWVYCAVTWLSNTVSVPSVTVSESLVQVTVVAGPPGRSRPLNLTEVDIGMVG